MKPLAVYVHIPFCPSKCGYCDFNSFAMQGEIIGQTMAAIRTEILRSPWRGRPASSIFFGGGTPTFPPVEMLIDVLQAVYEVHPPLPDCEITSEANPGTVDAEKFSEMFAAGIHRVSIGAQSFLNSDLIRLDRVHRADEIPRAVAAARQAGYQNLNLDLMFALPGQSASRWLENLNRAIDLGPEHLSLYCLTIEPNTAFYKQQLRGLLVLPNEDEQVSMYDQTLEIAANAGYIQYEISNFAKPGFECRHNLAYWEGAEYAGYGPGAVGAVDTANENGVVRIRRTGIKSPQRYVTAIQSGTSAWMDEESLSPEDLRLERVLLGLRLNRGIDPGDTCPDGLAESRNRGWIETDSPVRLTAAGRHFHSEVAALIA